MTLPFDAMHDEMRGAPAAASHGHHDAHAQPAATVPMDGAGMEIMSIRVRDRVRDERAVPATLSKIERPAESPFSPRLVVLDQAQGRWRINGRTYRIDETPLRVQRNTVEAWDIRNIPPGMPHPMHIHGLQFRVVSRSDSPEQQRRLALDGSGLAASDLGWKDTVLVWPGETVRIVTDFTHPFLGAKLSPLEAFLLTRGLRTLPFRLKRHMESALLIAERLRGHPHVTKIHHPVYSNHPGRATLSGFTGLFTFEVDEAIDIPRFADLLKFVLKFPSLLIS